MRPTCNLHGVSFSVRESYRNEKYCEEKKRQKKKKLEMVDIIVRAWSQSDSSLSAPFLALSSKPFHFRREPLLTTSRYCNMSAMELHKISFIAISAVPMVVESTLGSDFLPFLQFGKNMPANMTSVCGYSASRRRKREASWVLPGCGYVGGDRSRLDSMGFVLLRVSPCRLIPCLSRIWTYVRTASCSPCSSS